MHVASYVSIYGYGTSAYGKTTEIGWTDNKIVYCIRIPKKLPAKITPNLFAISDDPGVLCAAW